MGGPSFPGGAQFSAAALSCCRSCLRGCLPASTPRPTQRTRQDGHATRPPKNCPPPTLPTPAETEPPHSLTFRSRVFDSPKQITCLCWQIDGLMVLSRTPGSIPTIHCCVWACGSQLWRPAECVWRPVLARIGRQGRLGAAPGTGGGARPALPPASSAGPRRAGEPTRGDGRAAGPATDMHACRGPCAPGCPGCPWLGRAGVVGPEESSPPREGLCRAPS